MILIIDQKHGERADLLRQTCISQGLPCAISTIETIGSFCPAKIILTFMDILAYVKSCLPGEDGEIFLPVDSAMFYETDTLITEQRRILSRIDELSRIKYGINFDAYYADRYTEINGITRFAGIPIHLTETEKFIIRHLTLNPERWYTAWEIVQYCFDGDAQGESTRGPRGLAHRAGGGDHCASRHVGRVAVHIHNINRKTEICSKKRMIETRRFSGYRFVLIRPNPRLYG